ncbi:uncharacterized protein LOC135808680 [Sycon ciliatum]|uniref:uncharacterized protein LOC135808680 n=1 Tax=Sycon ciliatum TaxID=27933 RepID=UPI0020ABC3EE|eukprot:scpid75890/ scgid22606/ Mitogen-activated protein kinase 14; Mitogen-activated Mitogen-activated protein kinase 2
MMSASSDSSMASSSPENAAQAGHPPEPKFNSIEQSGTKWQTPSIYENLTVLPTAGAFGQVCSALNSLTDREVAIKKLSRPFQSNMDAKRTCREVSLLTYMRHENVISLVDVFSPDLSEDNFRELYIVTQLAGTDLNRIVKTRSLELENSHVQFIAYQIFRGLKYIHSAGIIHRDLKPANIAITEDCSAKIIDFGLARLADSDSMTGYVSTRWYRAPEILANWTHYNHTSDVWSVGCIIAEMITRQPLFPGHDHIDQLKKNLQLIGIPDQEFIDKLALPAAQRFFEGLPRYERTKVSNIHGLEDADERVIDLLEKIFVIDTGSRINVGAALAHPYFSDYHDPDDEPVAEHPFEEKYLLDLDKIQPKNQCEYLRKKVREQVLAWRADNPYNAMKKPQDYNLEDKSRSS